MQIPMPTPGSTPTRPNSFSTKPGTRRRSPFTMKLLNYIAAAGLLTGLSAASASADEAWTTDLAKAKETAKAEGKKILMNFTGSDW